MADTYDLIVLGSGPGGYVSAIRASQLGMKVAIVERERLGGICLNWGCIPTKALLRTSEVYHYMTHADAYGLKADNVGFDLGKIVDRSRKVAGQLNAGVKGLMKKNKVTVVEGFGTLTGKGKLSVKQGDKTVELAAKHIMVATGARARDLPFAKADGKRIWTYRHAMVPEVMPTKLLVIGSGAIGVEFASFYNDMGADVTIVEMLDRILPVEDAEVSEFMTKALTKQGIKILTKSGLEKLEPGANGVTAAIKDADGKVTSTEFSHAIVAIGIVPNTENIGLEALGVETERGHIKVDGYGRTNVEGIYAIGDVTGAPWLAHKASHEGIVCVEKIAGQNPHPFETWNIPGCTYSRPQVASVGLTETKAKDAGHDVKVGKFPFIGNGKAIALGEAEGFIKTVFDAKTGELLGAHMVGAEVTELIQGYVIARQLETTEHELMETVFAHPTLSEMMHESTLSAYGRALHF
ncbi:dihydrolipoyl dehydrogenase [Sphingomonas melonis TY]|jgi:dihydrolipoamide dehydrogenase|uniref:Dihydrolipoyl dehydrogenase n=2 Tax=Sphingomonas melonis TaxID=152682 RepID=A0A175Y7R2_9SPHN|nr:MULTISPECIES: dihydrolipoyl dehydrogenase [Sphingomonas]AOW24271.1 dihydrolipoyl dehydrogenase [Sphingomonas melonis TY]ATI55325.1 dihydrolipoyl dehydrogenase [Sphingomonas melonis]KZB96319.1 dihydrolipoyl dehydrogenase [Sphingomonas melonis TY]MBI0531482.1 dihydrolipoyl dehydrogenase [Sphingomonas sp. TX0522]MBX8843782.1 dihydrolipoyl dehydrogenase [Sphingomonas melonis]